MQTLELLRETTAVGLTDRFLGRLIERVEEIQDAAELRAMRRREPEFGAIVMLPGESFPAQLAG